MSEVSIRRATMEDIVVLAEYNKRLIEDEKYDNRMNIEQLRKRMKDFICGEYSAYVFMEDDECFGYALINMKKEPLYLRQFFIDRAFRKQGNGRKAFSLLYDTLGCKEIDLEVMEWNESGKAFWKALGFKTRSQYMRFEEKNKTLILSEKRD